MSGLELESQQEVGQKPPKPLCYDTTILGGLVVCVLALIICAIAARTLLFVIALFAGASLLFYYLWLRTVYPWTSKSDSLRSCTRKDVVLKVAFLIFVLIQVSSLLVSRAVHTLNPNGYVVFSYNLLATSAVLLSFVWFFEILNWFYVCVAWFMHWRPPWLNKAWVNFRYWAPLILWIPFSIWSIVNGYEDPTIVRLSVPIHNLPACLDGFRIAMASDVHVGALEGHDQLAEHVAMMNGLGGDIIVLVGDYGDSPVKEMGPAMEPVRNFRAPHGTFFVTGNHEFSSGDAELWMQFMAHRNVTVLDNLRSEVGRTPDCTFDLVGVQDRSGKPDLAAALAGRNASRALVMLVHQPTTPQVNQAADIGAGLMLSGHIHGGQTWPVHAITKVAFYYFSGLYRLRDTFVYVSEGAVGWGPRVRFMSNPDVALIELKTADYQIDESQVGPRASHRLADMGIVLIILTLIVLVVVQVSRLVYYRYATKKSGILLRGGDPQQDSCSTKLLRCLMFPSATADEWTRAHKINDQSV